MARPKPIGFDNWRTFSFVANGDSGFSFFRKASFAIEESGLHKLFAGPSIAATSAAADAVVTTAEPHGITVGQRIYIYGLPAPVADVLNGWQTVSTVPSATTLTVGVDTTTEGGTTGAGIAGVDLEARIPSANYAVLVGNYCMEDHPAAWEMPLEG